MAAQLIYAVIAVGLSLLAAQLQKKKNRSPVDDKPTVLATRGSYIPLLKGKRRLGFIFAYAGNRQKQRIKQGTKKWYRKREKVDTYFEDGWHILCCGPAQALYEVEQNGIPIFKGVLTRQSHPSGSTIHVGDEGVFRIYWGEDDQPIDSVLAARTGISSRWPGLCYVVWMPKLLGGAAQWQNMTYVVETYPQETILTESDGLTAAGTVSELDVPIWAVYQQLEPNPGALIPNLRTVFVVPAAGFANLLPYPGYAGYIYGVAGANGKTCRITGNTGIGSTFNGVIRKGGWPAGGPLGSGQERTLADDIALGRPAGVYDQPGTDFSWDYDPMAPTDQAVTYIEINEGLGSRYTYDFSPNYPTPDGTLSIFANTEDAGWNPAHLIAELLFSAWPHGVAANQDDFDMQSLEDLGVLTSGAGEDLRCSVIAQDGQELKGLLAGVMQDVGVFLSTDMATGKLTFVPIREPAGTLPYITEDAILQEPETEVQHGPRAVDRIVYTFPDAALAYRDATLSVDDDGQATRLDYYKSRKAQIISTVNFDTAARIVERRSAEDLSGVYENRLQLGRSARALTPGQAVIIEGLDEIQRVISTEHDVDSGQVQVTVWNDFYGLSPSEYLAQQVPPPTNSTPADVDYAAGILELPEVLQTDPGTTIVPLAIRSGTTVTGHLIYLSNDGLTFESIDTDEAIMSGGVSAGDQNDLYFQEDGPTFAGLGFDLDTIEDLTGDDVSWLSGRQVAVFLAADGSQEIAFVRNVTAIGGGLYQMHGVIRARYDTLLVPLAANTRVFIFQDDDGDTLQDARITPEVTLYMKAQPIGDTIVPLDAVEYVSTDLYGKGIRPVPVREIWLDQEADVDGVGNPNRGLDFYQSEGTSPEDDLLIRWDYSTPQTPGTGAGEFPFGQVSYDPVPEGDFLIEILDSMDVLKRQANSATASYTYLRTDRVADFSGEPASFKVRVTQIRGAYLSSPTTLTITHIS